MLKPFPIIEEADMLGKTINEIKVGDSAEFAKTISEADIYLFAGVTGDLNPFHVNEEYSKKTYFKGRIAHGMLLAGFISTVVGCKLSGSHLRQAGAKVPGAGAHRRHHHRQSHGYRCGCGKKSGKAADHLHQPKRRGGGGRPGHAQPQKGLAGMFKWPTPLKEAKALFAREHVDVFRLF
jgi:hypothetical protein